MNPSKMKNQRKRFDRKAQAAVASSKPLNWAEEEI